jgi:hypothetical protein
MPPRPGRDDNPEAAADIDATLRAWGFDAPRALAAARAVLVQAGLTRAGKRGIVARKLPAARRALEAALARACCDECARLARDLWPSRTPVRTGSASCEVCQDSNNRRAAIACALALRRAGVTRPLIVGGTDQNRHELAALLRPGGVTPAFVDGTRTHTQKEALANMRRSDIIVIWGSTPLKHAVSNLYAAPPDGLRAITVPRRGIEALCRELIRAVR